MMDNEWIPIVAVVALVLVALPWLILHYVTKWKSRTSLTSEDEAMLDDLYELARRLDDRMVTLERILHDENPNWNPLGADREQPRLARDDVRDLETELRSARGTLDLVKRRRA
jgi:phage shock protein B